MATPKLARMCGVHVADARLELRDSDSPIALICRFDRRGKARIPYISARTPLDWQGEEGGFYTDIADVIRRISSEPVKELHKLWRRIIFTILVSNKDDHLKNHGFTYAGGDQWQLTAIIEIGLPVIEIARHLGRYRASIHRELGRDRNTDG